MINTIRGILFVIAIANSVCAFSQIKVMSYNLLNFPTGNFQGRVDTLEKIINYYRPDLFMIQELKTAQGLTDVTNMMNDLDYGVFASTTYLPQQSNQGSTFPLQQAMVYNTNMFGLVTESFIETEVRDINRFTLYLKTVDLALTEDTVFLHVFVTHLKSSQGAENEALRFQMVQAFNTYLSNFMSPDDLIIFCGDFNLYSNQEPAYIAMTNENNSLYMVDPLASLGNWDSSTFPHKEILTQSTRTSSLMNDGAGGGVDDRFDFIMFSPALMSTNSPVYYLAESYKSLGNNGDCFNQNITACDEGNEVPFSILRSMYFMSDHLPQVCELGLQVELNSASTIDLSPRARFKFCSAHPSSTGPLCIKILGNETINGSIRVINSLGQIQQTDSFIKSSAEETFFISSEQFVPGVYLIELVDGNEVIASHRFLVIH